MTVSIFQSLLKGMQTSILFFFITLIFSLPLGFCFTRLRLSKYRVFSTPMKYLLWILRGSPLILQIAFFMYFPGIVFHVKTNRYVIAAFSLVINYAAYFAEIYRSGLSAIPKSQYEAASVLGFSKKQTFVRIVLPQVIKHILPTLSSEFMTLIKDTALISTIAAEELYGLAVKYQSSLGSLSPMVTAFCFYLLMNGIVSIVMSKIEKKFEYYQI